MHDDLEGHIRGVSSVNVLYCRHVCILKDGDDLVLEGGINPSALIIDVPILLVFSEEELLLPGRRPLWDECHSSRVRWANKGGVGKSRILLKRKNDPKVDVLPSAKVAIGLRRILHKKFVVLSDCRVDPSTVASNNKAVDMTSTPTAEVIGTSLVTIRRERIVRRQTSAL